MALSQSLQQRMLQKLSPQQIQLMKLLQVPTASLEQRVKEELEENPALELSDENLDESQDGDDFSADSDDSSEESDTDSQDSLNDEVDLSDYVSDDDGDVADYRMKDDNYPELDDKKVIPLRHESSFFDTLVDQLGLLDLNPQQRVIAEQIVGSLDDDGYLRRDTSSIVDDLAFRQNIIVDESEVESLITRIQQFDPAGICARTLQECLLLQLKRKKSEGRPVEQAIEILDHYFDAFTKKHYEKIQHSLNLSDEDLRLIIQQIVKLNPKPGGGVGGADKSVTYIIPDFFVLNTGGVLSVSLNGKNAPDLRISSSYKEMMKDYDKGAQKNKKQKEAVLFIKQKIDSAKWFIDMIHQRQHTLLSTMNAIVSYQESFFLTGDETRLKPMILKDIAEKTNLDISTVSRVASSKFVQTEFGTYRLKFFFSESISTDSGETVSTREVKRILSDLIEAEDKKKPLSDEYLTDILNKKGYNIARRTVAKYREMLNIPVARLRKIL